MTDGEYWVMGSEFDTLFADMVLTKEQQDIMRRILMRKITLPKAHREAVGLAYYNALAASEPWSIVNTTGTLIALLITSIRDAGNDQRESKYISQAQLTWAEAMGDFSITENDSYKFRAAGKCQRILTEIGDFVKKYGILPAGGFTLPVTQGDKK